MSTLPDPARDGDVGQDYCEYHGVYLSTFHKPGFTSDAGEWSDCPACAAEAERMRSNLPTEEDGVTMSDIPHELIPQAIVSTHNPIYIDEGGIKPVNGLILQDLETIVTAEGEIQGIGGTFRETFARIPWSNVAGIIWLPEDLPKDENHGWIYESGATTIEEDQ